MSVNTVSQVRVLRIACVLACVLHHTALRADVRLPSLFGNHMVVQRDRPIRIWGTAAAGQNVTVRLHTHTASTSANAQGRWSVELKPLPAGGPHQLSVTGKTRLTLEDVLVGEVWLCSGQSNMAFSVSNADDADLETQAANYPRIRLISVPRVGTQEPQRDFEGHWQLCNSSSVASFSAVGYFFGRQLHQTLDVPIGLIDNAWGGSAAEAWVQQDRLQADPRYAPLLDRWKKTETTYDHAAAVAEHQQRLSRWQQAAKLAKADGKPAPRRPRPPRNPLAGQHRPANLYNGVLQPVIGYGMRGVIWYQGESNSNRAYQYRHLFPLMIQNWRDAWKQGDFPFYWVQLADFRDESPQPQSSAWAELREAQTMTLDRLDNTGEAVTLGLGEAHDIHPRNKQDVASRLARWALAKDYGRKLVYRSPRYAAMQRQDKRILIRFEHTGGGLDTFDVRQPIGFAIAGADRKFSWATARIVGKDQIEVWSDQVPDPVAVRYAWADNPVCNLQNREGLPVTPFRTDTWPGVTINNHE